VARQFYLLVSLCPRKFTFIVTLLGVEIRIEQLLNVNVNQLLAIPITVHLHAAQHTD
jgi:hypothetical protein